MRHNPKALLNPRKCRSKLKPPTPAMTRARSNSLDRADGLRNIIAHSPRGSSWQSGNLRSRPGSSLIAVNRSLPRQLAGSPQRRGARADSREDDAEGEYTAGWLAAHEDSAKSR